MKKAFYLGNSASVEISRYISKKTGRIFFKALFWNRYDSYRHEEVFVDMNGKPFTADEGCFDFVYDRCVEFYKSHNYCSNWTGD